MLDLRGLPQLTHLDVYLEEEADKLQVSFPGQLQRLVVTGPMSSASWRSLGKTCTGLQQLDCLVNELPAVCAEACFPQLQKLRLEVHSTEAVEWAATLASRSEQASLEIAADPTPLTQPRFHGLQLDRLCFYHSVECTCLLWRNLRVHHLSARNFVGDRISADMLPSELVTCELKSGPAFWC